MRLHAEDGIGFATNQTRRLLRRTREKREERSGEDEERKRQRKKTLITPPLLFSRHVTIETIPYLKDRLHLV